MESGVLLIKMDIVHTFHTVKPGNFKFKRSNLNYIMTVLPWSWLKMRVSAKKNGYAH